MSKTADQKPRQTLRERVAELEAELESAKRTTESYRQANATLLEEDRKRLELARQHDEERKVVVTALAKQYDLLATLRFDLDGVHGAATPEARTAAVAAMGTKLAEARAALTDVAKLDLLRVRGYLPGWMTAVMGGVALAVGAYAILAGKGTK